MPLRASCIPCGPLLFNPKSFCCELLPSNTQPLKKHREQLVGELRPYVGTAGSVLRVIASSFCCWSPSLTSASVSGSVSNPQETDPSLGMCMSQEFDLEPSPFPAFDLVHRLITETAWCLQSWWFREKWPIMASSTHVATKHKENHTQYLLPATKCLPL